MLMGEQFVLLEPRSAVLTWTQAYNYVLTLNLEISLIWAAPWGVPTALFLLSRYLPLMGAIPILYCKLF
jgi:hypothetical protein